MHRNLSWSEGGCSARQSSEQPESESRRLERWIDAAAREVVRRLAIVNDGEPPRTLAHWLRCCERLSVAVVGLEGSNAFSAILIGSPHEGWTIFYNANANLARRCRYIAHELAEYITREQSWRTPPPDAPNASEYRVRHEIARRVESLCFTP